jgi:D-alanyl-D-alanine carboxypeptidase (penicillin-binding protein 5/6)
MVGALGFAPAYAVDTVAKHAFLIDANTGAVLLDKEGDVAMPPSSMSKLMTAYIVFQRLKEGRIKLDDTFTVSEKAWRMQGSKTFVPLGGQVSVEDLIHGIIIQSGNDACIVLAEGIAGSEEAFVAEMNRVGKELGLTGSQFANATGWPDEKHVMTARDLATLARHIIEDFPDYYHFYAMREYTYHRITQQNRNRLLGGAIGVDGLKTGHTEAAGYGIALSAKQNDRRLILIINGLESDNARVEEGDKLLRWGFREFTNKTLVRAGEKIAQADVWFGKQGTVALTAEKDLTLTLPVSSKDITFTLAYTGPLPAPIKKGDKVAELVIAWPQGQPQRVPLFAAEDVGKRSGLGHVFALLDYYIFSRGKTP